MPYVDNSTMLYGTQCVDEKQATLAMHDVPALDGTPPPEFRALAREDLSIYDTIHYANNVTIESIKNFKNGSAFYCKGNNGKTYSARKVSATLLRCGEMT